MGVLLGELRAKVNGLRSTLTAAQTELAANRCGLGQARLDEEAAFNAQSAAYERARSDPRFEELKRLEDEVQAKRSSADDDGESDELASLSHRAQELSRLIDSDAAVPAAENAYSAATEHADQLEEDVRRGEERIQVLQHELHAAEFAVTREKLAARTAHQQQQTAGPSKADKRKARQAEKAARRTNQS